MRNSVTLVVALALTLAACATTQPEVQPPTAKAQKPAAGCVPETATRLPVKDSECSGFGGSYDHKQLQSTGLEFADQQLQMLDPSVRGGTH